MKNFILFGISCLLFISCQKTETSSPNLKVDVNLINSVLSLKDEGSRVLAFQMLNPNERSILWKRRMDDIINSTHFSSVQLEIITYMRGFVDRGVFSDAKVRLEFQEMEPAWRIRSLKAFSEHELKFIFASLTPLLEHKSTVTKKKSDNLQQSSVAEGDCVCNQSSDYCSDIEGDCVSAGCKQEEGCGTFFLYKCNGYCSNMVIICC